jgi:hypothetical protein
VLWPTPDAALRRLELARFLRTAGLGCPRMMTWTSRSHVKTISRCDFLALGNIFQHLAYVPRGRDGDGKTVVELRVVPIHFRECQHLLCDVLERLSRRLAPQLERAGHVQAGGRCGRIRRYRGCRGALDPCRSEAACHVAADRRPGDTGGSKISGPKRSRRSRYRARRWPCGSRPASQERSRVASIREAPS